MLVWVRAISQKHQHYCYSCALLNILHFLSHLNIFLSKGMCYSSSSKRHKYTTTRITIYTTDFIWPLTRQSWKSRGILQDLDRRSKYVFKKRFFVPFSFCNLQKMCRVQYTGTKRWNGGLIWLDLIETFLREECEISWQLRLVKRRIIKRCASSRKKFKEPFFQSLNPHNGLWLLLKQCKHACKDKEQQEKKNHSLKLKDLKKAYTMPSPLIESVVLILHRAVASLLPTNLKGALLRGCCKFMLLILKRQVSFGYIFCAVCHVRVVLNEWGPLQAHSVHVAGSRNRALCL